MSTIAALAFTAICGCQPRTTTPPPQHYDDKEAALAHFEVPDRDAWAQPGRIVDLLHITPSMDLADIGAGSGYFTRRLAHAASQGSTYAVDVDADFKDYIETHRDGWGTPNIITRLAVYEHPLLPKGSVDLVFISNTYSFLQDRHAYFTAVHKALRPGGRLALIDWRVEAECPREFGCPKSNQRVPEAIARRELSGVGFVVLEQYKFLEYQYFLVLGRTEDLRPEQPIRRAAPTPTEPDPTSSEPTGVPSPSPEDTLADTEPPRGHSN